MSVASMIDELRAKATRNQATARAAFEKQGAPYGLPTQEDVVGNEEAQRQLAMALGLGAKLPGFDPSGVGQGALDAMKREQQNAQNFFEFDPSAGAEFRTGQQALIAALQNRAAGNAPSAAELAAQQQSDRGLSQAMALANSAQGVSPGLALRQAQRSIGEQNLQTMQTLASLRAQEQAQAEAALAQALSGARGQDMGVQQAVTGSRLDRAGLANDRERTFMGAQQASADRRQQQRNTVMGGMFGAGGALLAAGIKGAAAKEVAE